MKRNLPEWGETSTRKQGHKLVWCTPVVNAAAKAGGLLLSFMRVAWASQ